MDIDTKQKKYLGIDYGSKRVGVAVSDDQGTMAFPKCVIQNGSLEQVSYEVSKICNELGVKDVVLGESKNFKGKKPLRLNGAGRRVKKSIGLKLSSNRKHPI